jgi:hypothetical protein
MHDIQWGPVVPLALSIIVLVAAIVSLILALLVLRSV